MKALESLVPILLSWLPALLVLGIVALVLAVANRLIIKSAQPGDQTNRVARQLWMLALTAVGVIAIVLALPVDGAQKGQLLSLLGLLLSAAIALSSTTFLGNAIAGLMIRAVEDFRPGDFIRVGEYFGRVSERGLLHVEVQSDSRDLITIPNLHIVSNPVTVVSASGTVVNADITLGYDLDHARVARLLVAAAEGAGFTDPFVRVMALGDHAVSYRVSGFLKDVTELITARSRLHAGVLDTLQGDGIEIVSPSFMNQRVFTPETRFLFDPAGRAPVEEVNATRAESIVFDKAEQAALHEELLEKQARLVERRARIEAELAAETDEAGKAKGEAQLQRLDLQLGRLALALEEDSTEE